MYISVVYAQRRERKRQKGKMRKTLLLQSEPDIASLIDKKVKTMVTLLFSESLNL